jgi:thiol-disulfide isomerase/thioredoxin
MRLTYLVILCGFIPMSTFAQGLSIGDKVPDAQIAKIINYPKKTAALSDFKGKALILDFWGVWCTSCIMNFPKVDSLKKEFSKDIEILAVTSGTEKSVVPLLNRIEKIKGLKVSSVIEDTILSSLFPYRYVPQYVWIDAQGIVRQVTGTDELTAANIQSFVSGSKLQMEKKVDNFIKYDFNRPLFLSGQLKADEANTNYHSIITKYIQEAPVPSSRMIQKETFSAIECPNHRIAKLYQLAFGDWQPEYLANNRLVLEGFDNYADSIALGIFMPKYRQLWKTTQNEYSFCYEMVSPDPKLTLFQKSKIMREDLNRYFESMGIQGRREKRKVNILALVRTSALDKIHSEGGKLEDSHTAYYLTLRNASMLYFISKFQSYFPNPEGLPVQDETGYTGSMDIDINGDLSDIKVINKELEKYDLQFVRKEKEIDMIVITKKTGKSL